MKAYTIFRTRISDQEVRDHIVKVYYKTGSDDFIWLRKPTNDLSYVWNGYCIDEDGKINLYSEDLQDGVFWVTIFEAGTPFIRIFLEEGYFAELCVDIDEDERDPINHLSITDTPVSKDWYGDAEDVDYPIGLDTFDPTDFVGKYISDYYGDPSDDDQVPEKDEPNEEQPEKDPKDMNTEELKAEIQKAIERVSSISKDVESAKQKLLNSDDEIDDSDMRSWTDDEVELLVRSSELEGFVAGIALTLTVVGVTKGIKKLLRK